MHRKNKTETICGKDKIMAIEFTKAQLSAINCRDKTLLVSAAAGSGKTATLTQRIISSLTDEKNPLDITRMLIVTFTRSAAADLKSKISKALSLALAKNPSNRHLSKQLILLGSAKICTIDAFYLDIVRANCQSLTFPFEDMSLSPDFRIADNDEMEILSLQTMNTLIEDYYNKTADEEYDFASFVDNFTDTKNDKELAKILIELYKKILSTSSAQSFFKDYIKKLRESNNHNLFATFYGALLKDALIEKYYYYYNSLKTVCDFIAEDENVAKAYLAAFENDLRFCRQICEKLTEEKYSVTELRELFSQHSPENAGRLKSEFKNEETEIFTTLRKDFLEDVRAEITNSFSFDEEENRELTEKTIQIVSKLDEILSEYDYRIQREKLSRKICDFSDIRRYTKQVITDENANPTEIAAMYRDSFDAIYIDEYQDVDEVQDQIFRAISKENNLFMVGDIKQSIYAFRGAQSKIFAQLRKDFQILNDTNSNSAGGRTIFMSDNFRCDENIIKFTNTICSNILGHCKDTIDYKPEDDLIFSKKIDNSEYTSQKVTLCMIGYDNKEHKKDSIINDSDDESDDNYTDEALYITNEIKSLLLQKKADNTPIEPGDIAILTRAKGDVKPIEKALMAAGIPVLNNEAFDYFENPEVLLVTSLLTTIDNPYKDIHLAGTLRSPLFGFTLDDLIEIRVRADASYSLYEACEMYVENADAEKITVSKLKVFLKKLDEYRKLSQSLPVDKLIRYLYDDLFLLSYAGTDKDRDATHEQKKANLLRLYEYARRFEIGSFRGLHNFIGYLESILSENIRITTDNTESKNAVTIMTIHKSKGLEFPVCFICNIGKYFNTSSLDKSMIFETSVGVGIKINDKSGWARINTPLRRAVAQKILTSQTEEEMRIIYVALTRAREKLYLTAKPRQFIDNAMIGAKKAAMFDCRYSALTQKSYLSWILTAIEKVNCKDFLDIVKIEPNTAKLNFENREIELTDEVTGSEVDEVYTLIKKRFDYVYPYEHATKIPAKLSVSKLYPTVLDKDDEYAVNLDEDTELPQLIKKPDFFTHNKTVSAAQKGVATHTFLQFCDFNNCEKNGVENEISRLCEKGFINKNFSDIINIKQIENFFKSEFYQQIKKSSFVRREQRFNLLLPASKFTKDEKFTEQLGNDTLTVQGVIDLFFRDENGNIILCDYKTDYLTAEEFNNFSLAADKLSTRHTQQLIYYAAAIEQLCGEFPTKTVIYSLPLGKAIDVVVQKL